MLSIAGIWMAAVVGGVLLLAGVPKLRDRTAVLTAVRGYRLLPDPLGRGVAVVLAPVEVVLGTLMIVGVAPMITGAAATLLFAAFFAGLAINLLRGRRDLDCGCFAFSDPGSGERTPHIGWFHALRTLALALVSGAAAIFAGDAEPAVRLIAIALAGLALAVGVAVAALRAVVHPGRRSVDVHLARAVDQLHVARRLAEAGR